MVEIISISLENEMDLVLAGKRSITVADFFEMSLSSQTAFSTAISEISRECLENGNGTLGIFLKKDMYSIQLVAKIRFEGDPGSFSDATEGIQYAKRLISQISFVKEADGTVVEIKLNIPRSQKVRDRDERTLIELFNREERITPYEEIKRKNQALNKITEEQRFKLSESESLNLKKNEFFSIASHELKTPLTSIKAYAQLALEMERAGKTEHVLAFLEKINLQSTKLNKLIGQMLDISKVENGKLDLISEPVQVRSFVEDIIAQLKPIHPNHTITTELDDDALVAMDKLRIEQVFTNLLGNAAKYSKLQSNIQIHSVLDGDHIRFSVIDEGIGMTEESRKKVFSKYFRDEEAAKKFSGFGMGLFITAKIVEDHQGKIWVDSILGKGSQFHFTLPLLKEHAAAV